MQFEEESVGGLLTSSFVLFLLLVLLLIGTTGRADPVFLTSDERALIDHAEFGGKLFLVADQFSRRRDPLASTTFEPGMGDVDSIVRRGHALAYLVSRDVLYLIQHQTFDPASLAEGNRWN